MAKLSQSNEAKTKTTIVGDVPVDTVTVNAKGGSLAAIFKRAIRGQLSEDSDCYAASIEFEPGVSCVLMAPTIPTKGKGGKHVLFYVSRVSRHRYFIDVDRGDKERVDPATHTTLRVLDEMLKAGKIKFATDDFLSTLPQHLDRVDKIADKARARLKQLQAAKGRGKPIL